METATEPLPSAEERRLAALRALDVLDTAPEERFDRVTRLAQRLFGVPMAAISLIDRDRQWFKSSVGLSAPETDREDAFCDHTIRQAGSMVVPDALSDQRFVDNPFVTGDPHVRFYAGHPLEAGGERIGSLCIIDRVPRELTPAELDLLADLGKWVEKELAVDDELERAAAVQRSLLPRRTPDVAGLDLAGTCLPARQVGGDFFDWAVVGDALQVTVADVMGKGMGAAIVAATARAVLRSSMQFHDVAGGMAAAARVLEQDLDDTSTFLTVFAARIDPTTGRGSFVDAGHGLAVLVPVEGAPRRLVGGDLPLGVHADDAWTARDVELGPGDLLAVVSDGVSDAVESEAHLVDLVAGTAHEVPDAAGFVERLIGKIPVGRSSDDVTVVAVRRRAG